MKLIVECCDECPMFLRDNEWAVCNHPAGPEPWKGDGACGYCPCNLEHNDSHVGIHPECPFFKESITVSCESNHSSEADFLARQIVDDLYRAGIDARMQQHVIEQTILGWSQPSRGKKK